MDNQNQSYFKLPLFFTFMCYCIWTAYSLINYFSNIETNHEYDTFFIYRITLGTLDLYLLIYMISLYFFQKYRIYDLTKNWKTICLLIAVFMLIRYYLSTLEGYILRIIITQLIGNFQIISYDDIPICFSILKWFNVISVLGILIILFKIITFSPSAVDFNPVTLKKIHIRIFSLFLSYASLEAILLNTNIINKLLESSINVMQLFILAILLLWIILYKLFNIIVFDCFEQLDSQVSFKKLILIIIRTAFWSGFVSTIIVCLLLMLYMPGNLKLKYKIQFYSSYFLYIFSGINLLFSLLFCRYFIKSFYKRR